MYPIGIGYAEAKRRIEQLMENGHDAEALLASVFAFEKTIKRILRFSALCRGFSSQHCDQLFQNMGFEKITKAWSIFEKDHLRLIDILGEAPWREVKEAVAMRNQIVHGGRVYKLSDCRAKATSVINAMELLRNYSLQKLTCDPWSTLPARKRSNLNWSTLSQPISKAPVSSR